MKNSNYLKLFKKNMGNINHLLITICIGLEGVRNGQITKGETFSTTWNPKDVKASADRSRIFAIKATLVWITDNIDVYFSNILKEPPFLQDQEEFETIKKLRGVYNKYRELISYFKIENRIETAFIDLAISWRNKVVHTDANNDININSRKILKENKEFIKKNYCGLDVIDTINSFDNNKYPSFKEITSLISSSINFVYLLDSKLIEKINMQEYIKSIVEYEKEKELKNLFIYSDLKSRNKKLEHFLEIKYGLEKEDIDLLENKYYM